MFCYDESAKRTWKSRARKVMTAVARSLAARGVQVSPVRFNPGGIAVWGEASFYAQDTFAGALYAQAFKDLDGTEQILFRSEDWPEHLGGARGRKRMGRNQYLRLDTATDTLVSAFVHAASDSRY